LNLISHRTSLKHAVSTDLLQINQKWPRTTNTYFCINMVIYMENFFLNTHRLKNHCMQS